MCVPALLEEEAGRAAGSAEIKRLQDRLAIAGDILQRVRWSMDNDMDQVPDVAGAIVAEIDEYFGPVPSLEKPEASE